MECCIRCSLRGAFHLVVLPVPDPRLTGTPAHFSCKDAALPGSAAGTQMWRSAGNCVLASVAGFEACTQAIPIPSGSHGESCIVTGSIPRHRGTSQPRMLRVASLVLQHLDRHWLVDLRTRSSACSSASITMGTRESDSRPWQRACVGGNHILVC